MAVDLCSENSSRISFSHDLCQTDNIVPVEQHHPSMNSSSSIDFDFHVRESIDQDSSSADELFSDGKILPLQIKKKNFTRKQTNQSTPIPPPPAPAPAPAPTQDENSKLKEISKEIKITGSEVDEKQSSKSFWRFNRSSSLNCGSGYGRGLCPLPLLSRSNSTGSAPNNVKRTSLAKDGHNHKHHSQKHSSVKLSQSSSSASYQKPPLKKSYGAYINGISPVLHVPSASLFGLGSVFTNSKDKNKKK